ncbi:MAG: response regulator [Xanthobacteraceae bacterium]
MVALVVEDDPEVRALVTMILEETLDEPVLECESAEAAIEVLDQKEVDVLVTDIELAGAMNGLELADIARRKCPSANVIVMSGRYAPEQIPKDTTFLQKPWRALQLIQQVQR